MSVAEYTKIKIKNDPGRARRVGDARTFQRYAAGIIRLVPATALAIGRRIAHLMIPLLMVGVTQPAVAVMCRLPARPLRHPRARSRRSRRG
jgi:hypothetical protein